MAHQPEKPQFINQPQTDQISGLNAQVPKTINQTINEEKGNNNKKEYKPKNNQSAQGKMTDLAARNQELEKCSFIDFMHD